MRNDHHLGVHPNVATVAAQVDQARRCHGARSDLILERKWQVEAGGSIHVDGVQGGVGALHLQVCVGGHEKNVRNIVAMPLIKMTDVYKRQG